MPIPRQVNPAHALIPYSRYVLESSSHLCLDLPSGIVPAGIPTKILTHFFSHIIPHIITTTTIIIKAVII
jgi:hypothetical protein